MKILLAVDGSKSSLDAVNCVIDHTDWYREKPEVELVTVHLPVPKLPGMGMAVGKALVGSTATKVLHLSDVPVLLVK